MTLVFGKRWIRVSYKSIFKNLLTLQVIGTCVWAGVDSAWEQEKLEARKLLVNRAESPASSARCVGRIKLRKLIL